MNDLMQDAQFNAQLVAILSELQQTNKLLAELVAQNKPKDSLSILPEGTTGEQCQTIMDPIGKSKYGVHTVNGPTDPPPPPPPIVDLGPVSDEPGKTVSYTAQQINAPTTATLEITGSDDFELELLSNQKIKDLINEAARVTVFSKAEIEGVFKALCRASQYNISPEEALRHPDDSK